MRSFASQPELSLRFRPGSASAATQAVDMQGLFQPSHVALTSANVQGRPPLQYDLARPPL